MTSLIGFIKFWLWLMFIVCIPFMALSICVTAVMFFTGKAPLSESLVNCCGGVLFMIFWYGGIRAICWFIDHTVKVERDKIRGEVLEELHPSED